jgi:hypothetical protein
MRDLADFPVWDHGRSFRTPDELDAWEENDHKEKEAHQRSLDVMKASIEKAEALKRSASAPHVDFPGEEKILLELRGKVESLEIENLSLRKELESYKETTTSLPLELKKRPGRPKKHQENQ